MPPVTLSTYEHVVIVHHFNISVFTEEVLYTACPIM